MQTVTIGSKNQIVIPLQVRKIVKDIKPGVRVMIYPLDKETVTIKIPKDKRSWVERTRGIMKNAWKNIDPIKELDKMRDEW